MQPYRLISADSHFVEPPDMWSKRIDIRFRDRAPHTVKGLNGQPGEFFVCEDINPVPVAGFFGAGIPSDQLRAHNANGFEAAPKSVWDPAARVSDLDRDGIEAEVIYTSMGMYLFGLDDGALREACFRAFNDWAADYCSHDFKRLLPLALITLEDIPAAIAELERVAKRGMKGAMIWAEPPADRPYSDPLYEPFWAAAQSLEMPLSLHLSTGRTKRRQNFAKGDFSTFPMTHAQVHQVVERSIASMIFSGVLEKFPRLKIVSAENDAGWMAYFMAKLDRIQSRFGELSGLKLSIKASDYIKRQVFATFIEDEVALDLLHRYDNLMWSSDYPHSAATFPRSQEIVDEMFATVNTEQRRRIVRDTAAQLYGIK